MSSPDCEPDPTPATCPECGLDHPIGTPHPLLADTESEERQVEPRKPGAFRIGWCIECGAIKPDTDTREFPITVLNCHPDRIEWFVPASQLDSAIKRAEEAEGDVRRNVDAAITIEQRATRERVRAESAEALLASLTEAAKEVYGYLHLTDDQTHTRHGEACGVDACILCLCETVLRAALLRSPSPDPIPEPPFAEIDADEFAEADRDPATDQLRAAADEHMETLRREGRIEPDPDPISQEGEA